MSAVVLGDDARNSSAEVALMTQLAAGDRTSALGGLYDRYAPRLYHIGLRQLGDRGLAEELVQETFVRVWRSSGRFDPQRGSVAAFIYTIARRTAVDLHRRVSSRPLLDLEDQDIRDQDSGAEYDQVALRLEVSEALETLSEEQRSVLELHYREDLTQQQIADRLGLPLGTVKSRTLYGLRALKTELETGAVGVR